MGFTSVFCGSTSFDPDPDSTFHFDADPDPNPSTAPSFTHIGKSEKFFYFYSQHFKFKLFYLSIQRHRYRNFQCRYIGQYVYWNFLEKVELRFHLVEMDTNPDPSKPGSITAKILLFFNANNIFLYKLNVTVCSVSVIDGNFFLLSGFGIVWQKLLFYLLWDVLAFLLGWWRPRIRTGLILPRYPYLPIYLSPTIRGAYRSCRASASSPGSLTFRIFWHCNLYW